jgi:tetratricopeptide (TPR) repeat protein
VQKDKARFDLARQLHLSGRIEKAQKIYAELCKKYKDNHILFYLLGTTFLQIKKYDQAILNLEKSIKINSNYPDSYNNLGVSLAETKKY